MQTIGPLIGPDGAAWILECGKFDKVSLACARGVTLEKELAQIREDLKKEKIPNEEIERGLSKMRKQWSILECKEVNQALDVAGAKVAKEANL